MTPEAVAHLAAADRALVRATGNHSINFPDQAARLAYYAQFHAAQAMIFERTGRSAKTHTGVNRQLHKLAKGEPTLRADFAGQLTNAYKHKELADYDTERFDTLTLKDAADAIEVRPVSSP